MVDDTENISRKTWSRNIESVHKIGYMDGAADGQTAVFQSSFDMGYQQGFCFGIKLGSRNAISLQQEGNSNSHNQYSTGDPRKINCQICMNSIQSEQNVNLFNTQQEKNNQLMQQKSELEND